MLFAGSMGRAAAAAAAVLMTLAMSASSPAEPAGEPTTSPLIQAGDVAVTGFSGATLASEKLEPGVDPLDRTLIDPNGPALRVFDVSNLGGAPAGNIVSAPSRLDVPAQKIGQVFGMAFDGGVAGGPPNLYVAATSAFGLNIVGAGQAPDGKPVRLTAGAPDASFMEGQFGSLSDSSPGAIYKIDGASGLVSYLADTAFSGTSNSGPGIGGLAFDPTSQSLYASDLDTGVIHRFGLDYNAADLNQFDHGVAGRRAKGLDPIPDDDRRLQLLEPAFQAADPATWGFTPLARRINALAVHDGRLFYAVAEGPEIWSVGLNAGAFLDDARLEVKVKAQNPYPITGIAFDSSGRMYLAQRGTLKSPYDYGAFTDGGAEVLRYAPEQPDDPGTDDHWVPEPATFAVGTADDSRAADGGVSMQYGYKPDGSIDTNTCDATLTVSGDTLTPSASGVQINGIDLVRPANVPPTQSAFVDYDQRDEATDTRGHVGNVLALRKCGPDSGFPPVAGGDAFPPVEGAPDGDFPPVEEGGAGAGGEAGGGGETFPPVEEGGGGDTLPPVEEGGGGTTVPDEGGGETFPPVEEEGGGGETAEAGGVSITKSAVPGKCTEQGGCTFNIDITNNSGEDLPEVVVGDELTAGAANLGGAKIEGTPPAPWICTAPPKFSCKHPGIANGETISLPLSFTPTGIGQEKELKNCATLGAALQANPDPAKPAVALPEPTSSEDRGLKFEQKALTQPCTAGQACEWEIKVTNNNANAVTGNFVWFTDFAFINGAATARASGVTIESVTSANPQAVCVPIANDIVKQMRCGAENVTLPPGQSFTAKVKVKADAPADAPTAALQSTVSTDFTDTKQDQAIGKTTAASALVPPGQDGQNADGKDGAAAPSAPVCATLPVEPPDEPQPDAKGQPKLSITKTGPAECSDLGGCDFSIAIKNDGDAPFNGPVTVAEEVTLDGKSVPGALIVPNQTWTCTPGPTSTCTSIPQMIIGPQGTATLRVHVIYTAPTGAKTIQNCASVPGQTAKACASAPLIQGPKLAIKKESIDGVCDPVCTFRITVTNIGNQKFQGPIKIVDFPSDLKSDSGDTDIKAEVVSAKMVGSLSTVTCTKPGNIACEINSSLDPGISETFDLTMKTGLTDFAGDNCAMRTDVLVNEALQGKSCVAMLGLRHKGPNLVIDKEAPNAATQGGTGHCGLTTFCTFQITIKNIGDAPFTGVLHLKDTVGPGVPARILKGGGFGTCNEAMNSQGTGGFVTDSIDCDFGPFPEGIRPNDTLQLTVLVEAGKGWGSNKNLNNCAELSADTDMGPAETRKKDCADAKLDPFDVAVAKTGDQNCQPGGECRFDLDIFNPNPSVTHDDPVTVTDKLSGLSSAEIVSITPADKTDTFPCTPAPTKIPFTCTGPMKLLPTTHHHFTMVVRLPADASAASFSNCAAVGGAGAAGGASDPSCHSVQLSPPAQPSNLKISKTGPASCAPGSECAFDLTITNAGRKDHVGALTLTDGLSGVSSMRIVSVAPPLPCAEQPADIPFNCKTAEDFTLPAGSKRTFRVTARIPRSADATFTNCAILASGKSPRSGGTSENASSSCHTVKTSTPARTTEKPECKGGLILTESGSCACPPGTSWNGRNCVTRVSPPIDSNAGGRGTTEPVKVCPRSLPVGAYPNCCERNTHFDPRVNAPRGACVRDDASNSGTKGSSGGGKPDPAEVCPRSLPIGTFPNCCERNTHFDPRVNPPRGACVSDGTGSPGTSKGGPDEPRPNPRPICKGDRPVGTFPFCCPSSTHFDRSVGRRGACVRDPSNGGTDGTKPTPTRAVCKGDRPVGTFPFCCPSNKHFDRSVGTRGACVSDVGKGTKDDADGGGKKCAPGTIGKFPNCKCPLGWIGTPPKCCPPGSKFEAGKCVRPKPAGKCTGGRIGTPPSCACPPGTHWARSERCVENASPTSKPTPTSTPSKTEPSKAKCSGGRRGTPPNCFCLPPAKFLGGRCRHIPKPAQQKKNDGPIVK